MRQKTQKIAEYLTLISVKQEIFVSDLFDSVISAKENGTSRFQALRIEFRGNVEQDAIFLATKD